MDTKFFCGLDLGQAQDYTAFCVVEKTQGAHAHARFDVRHLERFQLQTPYPAIVDSVRQRMKYPPLSMHSELIADHTGVGRPVVDLLSAAGLQPIGVTITGGEAVSYNDGMYRVPKRILVSTLQILLQTGRLKVAAGLPEASTLVRELMNFQFKIDPRTAHDSYGAWREGAHDDLVLAVALACWYSERAALQTVQAMPNVFYDGMAAWNEQRKQLTYVSHDWLNCPRKDCPECEIEMQAAHTRGEIILSK